jgi:uracil-DNA glycosylase
MNWINFKDKFHVSYHAKIKPFIESPECDKIYDFLKKESGRGKQIAPLSSLTYRCFQETPLNEIKVVMMGMAPYHTKMRTSDGDVVIADGLLMGCSNTNVLQPSLQNFYDGIEKELYNGLTLDHWKNPDVSYLAKQGVFMFNASLTTELNKAGSHLDVWEPFTTYVLDNIVSHLGVPIIFLGKDAQKFEKNIPPFSWSFTLSHPASAAYKGTEWDTEGVFTKVSRVLLENNNFKIDWLEKIE